MPSEVSMRFGFRGLSHVITSGCTSSTDAIAYATRQLQLGTLPMMLVGGVDSPLSWGILKGFDVHAHHDGISGTTNRSGASRPFNLDRDGFVVAEGAWRFVLEEYESMPAPVAHTSMRRLPGMVQPVKPSIAYACRNAVKSRPAPSNWP